MNVPSNQAHQPTADGTTGAGLEQFTDSEGRSMYRSVTYEQPTGIKIENIYTPDRKLVRIVKSAPGSCSETYFCPETGSRRRLIETARMADGTLIKANIVYLENERTSQIVTILDELNRLKRIIEREQNAAITTFQGQTDYDSNGEPRFTVNQHMDGSSGQLNHREEIHWIEEGKRAMTEHFYFEGTVMKSYVKSIHYASAGIFSRETHNYDIETGSILMKQMEAFSPEGMPTLFEESRFNKDGIESEFNSRFYGTAS